LQKRLKEFPEFFVKLAESSTPLRMVEITQPFLISRTPVTNSEYARFLKAEPDYPRPLYWDDRRFNQPQQPVVGVSWEDAIAYCKWAGADCRLPTEAEWEYACRAGSKTDFCFGDDVHQLEEFAWYEHNSNGQTQPVGLKKANAWGLHDMHGNVWEWCADWYGTAYYATGDTQNPKGPATGPGRVLRGGCWGDISVVCSAWFRGHVTPVIRDDGIGFRLARTLPPAP
jgi:formylglycine-generating enzyme required for sulfatase activity